MLCDNCGKNIDDQAPVCPYCGAKTDRGESEEVKDKGGFLWGFLGFCIPIAGLIIYLVWKDVRPKTARAAGIGALIQVAILIFYVFLVLMVGIAFDGSTSL